MSKKQISLGSIEKSKSPALGVKTEIKAGLGHSVRTSISGTSAHVALGSAKSTLG